MAYIVETPASHPGIKLYICRQESTRRKPVHVLEGKRDDAVAFPDRPAAELAIMQFSSLYGLIITEIA